MKKTQHFIRPLSKQVDIVLSMFALSGLREGLKNNGVDNITDFVEAKTVEQEKRDNVLRCDLGRLGVVKKADGAVALTGSQSYADAKIQDHEFFKKKLREISAAFGGNESLAVSIYRLCCGQGGNDVFYKGKDKGEYREYRTGYWVSSNLMTFFKLSMSKMEFRLNEDNESVVIRKKTGENDVLLFEFSQHFLRDVAANLSGNATFKIVIEAKIIEGGGLDITSVKEISFDTVLKSESADELNAVMREMNDGISAFDKSNVEHPNALKSGLAFITLQENMLTIQKGDVVSEYDISGPNQAAVSDALSKLVDVLPQLEDTVIRQLIDVLSHCEPKVSEQLTSVLSRCNSRTAGVLTDILSQLGNEQRTVKVVKDFINALYEATEKNKDLRFEEGIASIQTLVEGMKKEREASKIISIGMYDELGAIIEEYGKLYTRLKGYVKQDSQVLEDDVVETMLFLSRYGTRASDALKEIVEKVSSGKFSSYLQLKSMVTVLLSENAGKIRGEIARVLKESDVATNQFLLDLMPLLPISATQPTTKVTVVNPLSTVDSQRFQDGLAGLLCVDESTAEQLLVNKLRYCGFGKKDRKYITGHLLDLLKSRSVDLAEERKQIGKFISILLQSDKTSVKQAVKAVQKCRKDFVRFISSVEREVGSWLYGYAKLLDTRSKKSAIKIAAGWAKFSESKSCGESVLSQSVFKVENREYPLFGLVASHSHPEAFAQALVSLKEAGAEFNDALVQCVFKMNEQRLKAIAGESTAMTLKTSYDALFPKGSQALVQFDMFLKNMLGIPEDKKSLVNNILRRAGELFASINIVLKGGKKIDLGWLMERLVGMTEKELRILSATVTNFDAGSLLKKQEPQAKYKAVDAFLDCVSDPKDQQVSVGSVISFLKTRPDSLTASTFDKLKNSYSANVLKMIASEASIPKTKRRFFQRVRDWFMRNVVHRKTAALVVEVMKLPVIDMPAASQVGGGTQQQLTAPPFVGTPTSNLMNVLGVVEPSAMSGPLQVNKQPDTSTAHPERAAGPPTPAKEKPLNSP